MHIEVNDFLVECSVDRQHASFGAESLEGGFLRGGSRRKGSLGEGDTEKAILDNEPTSSFSVLSDVILTPPTTEFPQKTTAETKPHSKTVMWAVVSFLGDSLSPYAIENIQKTTPETHTPETPTSQSVMWGLVIFWATF